MAAAQAPLGLSYLTPARLGQRFEMDEDVKDFVADMERYYRQTLAPGETAHADTGR